MEENASAKATVKSVGVKWGLITTAVNITMFLVPALAGMNPFDQTLNWIGIAVGIVIIVLAHKDFKDNGDGYMNYGQGIGIALIMGAVSTLIGGLFTYLYTTVIDTGVMEMVYQKQREAMEAQNQPEANIEMAMKWTKMLFWPIYVFFGVVGTVIIALIVTIFTQKKRPESNF